MNKKPLAIAVSAALMSLLTLPALAADEKSADKEKDKLEVITVTATKHVTNLMETPLAITAMNPEALTRQNIKSISDLSGMVPNLQLGTSNSDSGVKASIRGVTSNNFTEIGDPAVGIHIDGISHVVNYNLPEDPEDYVHRIGRTGRAGASGISISFACEDEAFMLPDIEELLGRKLKCELPPEDLLG